MNLSTAKSAAAGRSEPFNLYFATQIDRDQGKSINPVEDKCNKEGNLCLKQSTGEFFVFKSDCGQTFESEGQSVFQIKYLKIYRTHLF